MRSAFKVLFYLKRNAPKKNGLVPVMCRITVNGKVSQFSSKLDVEEKSWNVELGRVSGRSIVAQEINRMLDKIRVVINKAYQDICDRDNYVIAEKVRNAFLGMGMKHETLLAVFRQHNEDYKKQVGKIKSERSYWKYCTVYNHLSEFIKQRYKVSDIALKELAPAFITDFELFLRTEKNHCTNTVWSYMMPFQSIIFTPINNGWLQRDPFYGYSITKEETKRGFLTKEEITLLINGTFKKKSYEQIRDLFIFCTFTGLSWTDMANLTKENLQISFDGHLWIKTNRQKTGTESNLRLLEVAKHIIEKYEGMAEGNKLLPVPCYPNCKNGIKVIAKHCGIDKTSRGIKAGTATPRPYACRMMYPSKRFQKCSDTVAFVPLKFTPKSQPRKSAGIWINSQNRLSRWRTSFVRDLNNSTIHIKHLPMKRELKIGESQIITIDEYGVLTIPSNPTETVWMNDCELVELFGVTFPTLRTHIKSVLKSGVVCADFRYGATQYGNQLLPDCYGLEMIMALAFRIQSPQAELFRRWILEKVTKTERSVVNQQVFISVDKSINRLIN